MKTMVSECPCECESKEQDAKYGPGRRLFKRVEREGYLPEYRCTICGWTMVEVPRAFLHGHIVKVKQPDDTIMYEWQIKLDEN